MRRFGKIAWKILKWLGENLPLFLVLGAAFYAGFYLDDKESMHFFIILGAFYIVIRELSEIRHRLINLAADEGTGKHSGV